MNVVKKFSFLLIFALCVQYCLYAQPQGLYYFYKGEQVALPVNNQHFLVYADENEISKEDMENEYKIVEWIVDGGDGILEAQVNISNGNYDSVINALKAKEYIIDIEPVIGISVLYNTSRLFYVTLHDAQDYPMLNSMASRLNVEISGEVPFCDNWYEIN